MILVPSKPNASVMLMNYETNSWVLSYLTKMQDKLKHIYFYSDGVVNSMETTAFNVKTLGRSSYKSAIEMGVRSIPEDGECKVLGVEKGALISGQILASATADSLIVVIDSSTPIELRRIAYNVIREIRVIEVTGNEVRIFARNEKGEIIPGYDVSTPDSVSEATFADKIMISTTIFMIINKMLAGEGIISNSYSCNSNEITIERN